MFTGIVTDVGQVRSIVRKADWRCEIASRYDAGSIDIGASISCAGVCLTVVSRGEAPNGSWFAVEVSEETRRATTIADWQEGQAVNLERSLKVGEEIGGHIVLGHVDAVGTVKGILPENGSLKYRFEMPARLAPMIAEKGSIAVDGVSLTVNAVGPDWFEVNLVPHTLKVTTFGTRVAGERVNIEVDVLARYVARIREFQVAR